MKHVASTAAVVVYLALWLSATIIAESAYSAGVYFAWAGALFMAFWLWLQALAHPGWPRRAAVALGIYMVAGFEYVTIYLLAWYLYGDQTVAFLWGSAAAVFGVIVAYILVKRREERVNSHMLHNSSAGDSPMN